MSEFPKDQEPDPGNHKREQKETKEADPQVVQVVRGILEREDINDIFLPEEIDVAIKVLDDPDNPTENLSMTENELLHDALGKLKDKAEKNEQEGVAQKNEQKEQEPDQKPSSEPGASSPESDAVTEQKEQEPEEVFFLKTPNDNGNFSEEHKTEEFENMESVYQVKKIKDRKSESGYKYEAYFYSDDIDNVKRGLTYVYSIIEPVLEAENGYTPKADYLLTVEPIQLKYNATEGKYELEKKGKLFYSTKQTEEEAWEEYYQTLKKRGDLPEGNTPNQSEKKSEQETGNEPGKDSSEEPTPARENTQEDKEYIKTLYAMPKADGTFNKRNTKEKGDKRANTRAPYIIKQTTENEGEVVIHNNDVAINTLVQNRKSLLDPYATYPYIPVAPENIYVIEPGKAKFENGQWVIEEKMKIAFKEARQGQDPENTNKQGIRK